MDVTEMHIGEERKGPSAGTLGHPIAPAARPDTVLESEAEIVWLEDVSALKYVREIRLAFQSRVGKPRNLGLPGRVVGYSTVKRTVPRHGAGWYRRVFWLKEYDHPNPGPYADDGWPSEGVDPKTVKPGVPGDQPQYTYGYPIPIPGQPT